MPYRILRVLKYRQYLDYVQYEISNYSRVYPEPRLREKHNSELFEAWTKRAEQYKKASEKDRTKTEQTDDSVKLDMPQADLTAEFFDYYVEREIEWKLASSMYEFCFGEEMPESEKHRTLFVKDGVKQKVERNRRQEAQDRLNTAIEVVDLIGKFLKLEFIIV